MAIIEGKLISISAHTRRRPGSTVDPLVREYFEFVGNVLAMELEHALIEPLDGLDMPEGDKQRVREAGF